MTLFMKENEMEDLLYAHPDLLLGEPLQPVSRQVRSGVGVADLVFAHPRGYRIVVEVKCGVAPRGVGDQLFDYWGAEKAEHPDLPIEMMVVANEIPRERKLFLEKRDIDYREISVKKFRDVAAHVGYTFKSEQGSGVRSEGRAVPREAVQPTEPRPDSERVGRDETLLAMFASLEPSNLDAAFGLFAKGNTEVWLGTGCRLVTAKKELPPGARVYLKANGEKEVGAQAELIGILKHPDMPDPDFRLPGYEQTENIYYYGIRRLERPYSPIEVTSLVCRSTRKNLVKTAQGVLVIHEPEILDRRR